MESWLLTKTSQRKVSCPFSTGTGALHWYLVDLLVGSLKMPQRGTALPKEPRCAPNGQRLWGGNFRCPGDALGGVVLRVSQLLWFLQSEAVSHGYSYSKSWEVGYRAPACPPSRSTQGSGHHSSLPAPRAQTTALG